MSFEAAIGEVTQLPNSNTKQEPPAEEAAPIPTNGDVPSAADGDEKLPFKRKRRNLFDIKPEDLGTAGLPAVPFDQPLDNESGEYIVGPGAGGLQPRASEAKRALPKLTREKEEMLAQAKRFAMEQSVQHVLNNHKVVQAVEAVDMQTSVQRQKAFALMCKIYIGGLNFHLDEEAIQAAFVPFGPIRSVDMSRDQITQAHKGFSFVEYDLPEGAQLALEQMNNVLLGGRNIKVGRPSNVPQALPWIEKILGEAQEYARIYVSSIHPDLSKSDISSVFEAFGKVKACDLAPDMMTGKHKGFGFIEYETQQSANDAIVAMNLFDLGGQYLRVGRAITPPKGAAGTPQGPPPTAAVIAATAISANIQVQENVQKMGVAAINAMNPLMNPMSIAQSSASVTQSTTTASRDSRSDSSDRRKRDDSNDRNSRRDRSRERDRRDRSRDRNQDRSRDRSPEHRRDHKDIDEPAAAKAPEKIVDRSNDSSLSRAEREREKKRMEILGIAPGVEQNIEREENLEISGKDARYIMMQKLTRSMGSSVLVLRNMVDASEVDADLEREVTEECSLFGDVNRVVIYQEKQGEAEDAEVIVKIFAEFRKAEEAESAQKALHGRWFGGRGIVADIYDEEKYNAQDFAG